MSSISFQNLKGHFLIAMPNMVDPVFANMLTLICEHHPKGTLGIIVNRPAKINMSEVFRQIGIRDHNTRKSSKDMVYSGGPVAKERGFVLSSDHRKWASSLDICQGLQLVTSTDILTAIAEEKGPNHSLVALGYAGWETNQLEKELRQNCWLTCKADPSIIFETPWQHRLTGAASTIGVNLQLISTQAGHA